MKLLLINFLKNYIISIVEFLNENDKIYIF